MFYDFHFLGARNVMRYSPREIFVDLRHDERVRSIFLRNDAYG